MIDLTKTLIAFAKARRADAGFDDEAPREWARQNVDALALCVIFAEAKAHAEELDFDARDELEAALEGLVDLFVTI